MKMHYKCSHLLGCFHLLNQFVLYMYDTLVWHHQYPCTADAKPTYISLLIYRSGSLTSCALYDYALYMYIYMHMYMLHTRTWPSACTLLQNAWYSRKEVDNYGISAYLSVWCVYGNCSCAILGKWPEPTMSL